MKTNPIFITAILFLFLSSLAISQNLAEQPKIMQEFHQAEWRMKAEHWKHMQARLGSDLLLDQADYDVKYWELNINVTDNVNQIISGHVVMTSQVVAGSLTQAEYDLHSDMVVDSVLMGGQTVSYTHSNHMLTITLDQAYGNGQHFTTDVYYHGHPAGSGLGSFTWDEHNGTPIISSLSEPEGAREWWPCKDTPHDKADSADIIITVPVDMVATSNGLLMSNVDNGNGTRTFHWHSSYPITTYLISLAITNYQSITDWYVSIQNDSMPVVHYVYPEHYNQAVTDLSITPDAIEFLASLFGEYPFVREKYGHSIFPWGGAMEHQCNTSYGQWLIRGDHSYDWILVHELSHQWFGDMISCDIWPEIWMNEGFASYCEALWAEHTGGTESYRYWMESVNGVTYPSGPIYDPDPLFDGNTVYNKGSWVLHMLRGIMGDDVFFDALYAYAGDPRYMYGTITTRQFQAIMEQYYGASLGWFFDQWIWGVNRPFYTYSWMKEYIGEGQYEIFFHLDQTQSVPSPEVFIMPIKIYPRIGNQDTIFTVFNDSRIDDFRFIVNGDPVTVQFDKYNWILKFAALGSYGMNIVTTALPDGAPGSDYSALVEARGGQQPYMFEVTEGFLPPGLTLDENTGDITGIPDTEGVYSFTIRCTDSSTQPKTDTQEFVIDIGYVDVDQDTPPIPMQALLIGNYPNPFNNSTVIKFSLSEPQNISLEIFNMLGQKVAVLHDGYLNAGQHEIVWNAGSASSGVYFYKLTADNSSEVRKMTLLK
jgi:aminopeptidase N